MIALALAAILLVALTCGGGWLAHTRFGAPAGGPTAWGRAAAERFGAAGGALAVVVVGVVVVLVVGLLLGLVARAVEEPVDEPFFDWVSAHAGEGTLTRQMAKLTLLGDIPMIQVLALLGGVVLAFAYRRSWWVPVLTIAFAYVAERLLQTFLAGVIDRGHPVGATGTYPSGGVGRTLVVYGAIVACTLVLLPALSKAQRAGAWTGLAVLAVAIGVSRLWLDKHWLSDVVMGFPFGVLLLLTAVALLGTLTASRDRRPTTATAA